MCPLVHSRRNRAERCLLNSDRLQQDASEFIFSFRAMQTDGPAAGLYLLDEQYVRLDMFKFLDLWASRISGCDATK
jgi:hypothetical protein